MSQLIQLSLRGFQFLTDFSEGGGGFLGFKLSLAQRALGFGQTVLKSLSRSLGFVEFGFIGF
ncbi:hypothetical protein CJD35_22060 (plasmid) [Sphingobium xenophagum]|uniref:Uncharacterized protein n=1 Tax=Sphingobium xenophagum TaxID=121428 RepID=A0A249N0K4_SPHXE|nr:hypothetical protein CJD35_22060 [Sphingobium xenophagum]